MGRQRLLVALALLFAACSKAPLGGSPGFDASVPCEDRDHDGYGRGCERGYDCDDSDPRSTTECRSCSRPERGCECEPSAGPVSCFLDDQELEGGDMPPWFYLPLHAEARLSEAERSELIAGLQATFGASGDAGERPD